MKYLDCSTLCLPLLCQKLSYYPTMVAQAISCLEDGEIIAGVVYDLYNGRSVNAHIWVHPDRTPSRAWYAAIFDYPFNRLGVDKIVGSVASGNSAARKLDEHFGFELEAVVRGYSEDGDLLLYTMTRAQCRVLNSPRWGKVIQLVGRAA